MTALAQERMLREEKWKRHLFPLATGVKAYKGGRACIDTSTGNVVPGKASTTLLSIGLFAETVDNTSGGATTPVNVDLENEITVRWFANDAGGSPVAAANLGSDCWIKDDQTVTLAANGNSVAGRIWAVDTLKGVGVQQTGGGGGAPGGDYNDFTNPSTELNSFTIQGALDALKTRLTARVASTANVTIASPGATIDGVTMAAGDKFFAAKQTTASEGGLWQWNGAAVPATRPPEWLTGSIQASGTVVQIGGEGTANANGQWKLTSAACTVGTSSPAFYPRIVKGSTVLVAGTKTITNLFILAGAFAVGSDQTAANAVAAVPTAGQGTGSLVLTGTGTDTVLYEVANW